MTTLEMVLGPGAGASVAVLLYVACPPPRRDGTGNGNAPGVALAAHLLGAVVGAGRRACRGGVNRLERGRQRSIAAASAPLHGDVLAPDEQVLADAHHALVEEWRTGEQPLITVAPPPEPSAAVRRRAAVRRPTRWQRVADARRRRARLLAALLAADPLRAPLDIPLERPVVLAGLAEPAQWNLESFTESWTTGEIAALIEQAKAGAQR